MSGLFVVQATASILLLSAITAGVVVLAPVVGLSHHPRAAVAGYLLVAAMSTVLISIHVAAPLVNGVPAFSWSGIATDYFLAMAHHIDVEAPYPFFWSRPWEYEIGGFTWLIGLGGVVMVATAVSARPAARKQTPFLVAGGLLVVALFIAAAAHSAIDTWHGVPL